MSSFHLWHCQLGHVSFCRLKTLVSSGQLGHDCLEDVDCLSCQIAKQPALPFNKSNFISTVPLDLVHSDIWGPSPTPTMGGSRYFVM